MIPGKRNSRITLLAAGGLALSLAAALTLSALNQNISYFYSPLQIKTGEADTDRRIRLGGLVAENSVKRGNGIQTLFDVTDGAASIRVSYSGILPDLFREGQGVIAEGSFNDEQVFLAETILAKHDETYRPKELDLALKRAAEEHSDAGR